MKKKVFQRERITNESNELCPYCIEILRPNLYASGLCELTFPGESLAQSEAFIFHLIFPPLTIFKRHPERKRRLLILTDIN